MNEPGEMHSNRSVDVDETLHSHNLYSNIEEKALRTVNLLQWNNNQLKLATTVSSPAIKIVKKSVDLGIKVSQVKARKLVDPDTAIQKILESRFNLYDYCSHTKLEQNQQHKIDQKNPQVDNYRPRHGVRSRSKQELKYHEEKTPSNYTSLKRSTDRSIKNSIQDTINDKYQFINAESQSNSKNIFSSSKNYKKNKIESQYRDKYNPNSIENVLNVRLSSNTNLKDKQQSYKFRSTNISSKLNSKQTDGINKKKQKKIILDLNFDGEMCSWVQNANNCEDPGFNINVNTTNINN